MGKSPILKSRFSVCDPNLINELTFVAKRDFQGWAKKLSNLLIAINTDFADKCRGLSNSRVYEYRALYRKLVKEGKIESTSPSQFLKKKSAVQIKKTRYQDLLDKLEKDEENIFTLLRGD